MSEWRDEALERLDGAHVDLVVVGAGIIGARVAYEAARAGLRVALLDAGDVGGATSSASSKLLHGGFRYLALGSYGLVHAAQVESRVLATRIAPHLSRPLPVVLAMERGRWPEWRLSTGLMLYFGLAGFRPPRPRLLDAEEARAIAPELRSADERIHLLLPEYQTDDSRLVLATAVGAARSGAIVAPYVEVVGLEGVDGPVVGAELLDRMSGRTLHLRTQSVVNASGPWIDAVRAIEDPGCAPIARLSKGVHVTLPLPTGWRALVAFYSADDRTSFVAPWQGTLLAGTTDTEYEGDPSLAAAGEQDVDDVLSGVERILPAGRFDRSDVLAAWAGLRVLPRTTGDTASIPRERLLQVGPRGVVSIAGGKLTTHRRLAAEALALLPAAVRPRRLAGAARPLPGSAPSPRDDALESLVDAGTARHLRSVYGSEAGRLLVYVQEPDALERIHPDGPDVWAQVAYAVEREWACTADDVLRRRTTLAYRGLATSEVRAAVLERLEPARLAARA
jgi:glycerol-3-phosphate dehydrogenase